MNRPFSPKRLQKEGRTGEAFEYYKKRYKESLKERDSFLSVLYLDEIAQTLIIGHKELSFDQLREGLAKVTSGEKLDKEEKEQADLDLRITLRKRFPEKFKDEPDEIE